MSGWNYGKALIGAVTEGVKDLVQPDFEDEEYDGVRAEEAGEKGQWGEAEDVVVPQPAYARLQAEVREARQLRQQAEADKDMLTALQDQNRSLKEALRAAEQQQQQQHHAGEGSTEAAEPSAAPDASPALREEVARVTEELQRAAARAEKAEAGLGAAETARVALEHRAATLEQQLSAAKEVEETLRKSIRQLREEAELRASQEEDTTRLREEAKEAHRLRLQVTTLQAAACETDMLRDELAELQDSSQEADERASALQAKVDELEAQLSQAQTPQRPASPAALAPQEQQELLMLREEAATLHTKLASTERLHAEELQRSDELSNRVNSLKSDAEAAATLHGTAVALRTSLEERDLTIDTLRRRISELEATPTPHTPAATAAETHNPQADRDELPQPQEDAAAPLQTADGDAAELHRRIYQLEADAERMHTAAAGHADEVARLTSELQGLQRMYDSEKASQDQRALEMDAALAKGQQDAAALGAAREEAEGLRASLDAAVGSASQESSALGADVARLSSEAALLQEEVQELRREKAEAERTLQLYKEEVDQLKTGYTLLEGEATALKDRAEERLRALDSASARVGELEEALRGVPAAAQREVLVEEKAGRARCIASQKAEESALYKAWARELVGLPPASPATPSSSVSSLPLQPSGGGGGRGDPALQEKLRLKDEEIRHLNTLVLELQRRSAMSQSKADDVQDLQKQLAAAQEALKQSAQKGAESAEAAVAVKDAELESLREKLAALEKERAGEKAMYNENIEKYHDWHKASQKTLDETAALSEKRRVELESHYTQLREYHGRVGHLTAEVKRAEEECCSLRASLAKRDTEADGLREQVNELHDELDLYHHSEENRKTDSDESARIITTLTAQLKDLNAEVETERQRAHEMGSREDEDARERDMLLDRASAAESRAAAVEAQTYSRIEELTQKLVIKDEEIHTLAVRISATHADEEARQAEVKESLEKVENLQSVLDHFVSEREEDIRKANHVVLEQLRAAEERCRAADARLTGKDDETEEVRRSMHKEIAQRNSMITTLQNKLAQMRRLMDETLSRCNEDVMIEKKFVTKLFLQYMDKLKARADLREILTIMAGVLGWSDEEKVRAGAVKQQEQGSWWNMLTPSKQEAPDQPVQSLSDMWVTFLMQEAEGGSFDPNSSQLDASGVQQSTPAPAGAPEGGGGGGGDVGAAEPFSLGLLQSEQPFHEAAPLPALDLSQDTLANSPPASPAAPVPQADE